MTLNDHIQLVSLTREVDEMRTEPGNPKLQHVVLLLGPCCQAGKHKDNVTCEECGKNWLSAFIRYMECKARSYCNAWESEAAPRIRHS